MTNPSSRLLIGLSPRIMRNLPREYGFRGKTLQYLEQSIAHWVIGAGAMVVMVPTVERESGLSDSDISVAHYVQALDGLILQGGVDIDPVAYGEAPSPLLQPTDVERDRFELRLLQAFMQAGKPVIGICRGMQLINVAHGGTLHQDLVEEGATGSQHVAPSYDEHMHPLRIDPQSWFASLYPRVGAPMVNSIHHQGIKRLGGGLAAQAWSDDGVIECIRGDGPGFVLGLQWHPEFHDARFPQLLPGTPILQAFLVAAKACKSAWHPSESGR